MQVSFHKTVAALEWLLADIIHALLRDNYVQCSQADILKQIENETWQQFDDGYLLGKIREFHAQTDNAIDKTKADFLLNRKTPSLVAELEVVANRDYEKDFDKFRKGVQLKINEWANKIGIDSAFWHVWSKKRTLTALGNDQLDDPESQEKAEKAVRIMDTQSNVSYPLINYGPSIMSVLGNYELFALRIYVLIDENEEMSKEIRDRISKLIKTDIADANWR
ncbi:MAG: hypothetical protein K2X81_18705, partial [Candidatus Obscuribacterales bacterium]|nr:hypothetical protein [Candidatus Obscuribacterales bacterium]